MVCLGMDAKASGGSLKGWWPERDPLDDQTGVWAVKSTAVDARFVWAQPLSSGNDVGAGVDGVAGEQVRGWSRCAGAGAESRWTVGGERSVGPGEVISS